MLAGFRFECFLVKKSIGILSLTVFLRTGILSSECYRGRLRRSQVSTININPDLATFTKRGGLTILHNSSDCEKTRA